MGVTAHSTLTRKALVGTSWSAFSTIARQVMALGGAFILARLLNPEIYGLMGMVSLIAIFLYNFRDLGTTTVIVQRPAINERLLSTLFWVNCGLGLLLCLIVLAVAIPAAHFFKEPRLAAVLAVSSVSFLLGSTGLVHNAVLTRSMEFGKLGFADLMSGLLGYVVAIPCALLGLGVWSLVLANLTNSLVLTVLLWKFSGWTPAFAFDGDELRSVRAFSLNLSGFGLVNYFSRNADNIVVGKFVGESALGYYQMAYNLMIYPIQNISSLISQVLRPAFTKIHGEDDRFRSAYVRSCMLIGLFTFPIIAGMGILANPMILAMLGEKWRPAIVLFQLLAPVGFAQSLHTTVGQIYISKARPDLMLKLGSLSALLFVISFLIGVRYGAEGVAAGYCISYLGIALYPGLAVPFRLIDLKFSTFIRHLWPQLAITAAMGVACYSWLRATDAAHWSNAWLRLAGGILVGMAVYLGLMIRTRPRVVEYFEEVVEHSQSAALIGLLKKMGLFPER